VFTALSLSCNRTCTWTGSFTVGDAQVLPGATYDGKLPQGTRAGDTFPRALPGRLERGLRRSRVNHVGTWQPHAAGLVARS
jgi:hypothetical protein